MSIGSGWAEFNGNATIRGRMVAAKGTFSGTFAADNIDAVDTINIRDGAVSAYYGFGFPGGSQVATFTVPAQPHAAAVDIVAPIIVESWGANFKKLRGEGFVEVYKDSALVSREPMFLSTAIEVSPGSGEMTWYMSGYMSALQVVRYIDLDVSPYYPSQWMIKLINSSSYKSYIGPGEFEDYNGYAATKMGFLGSIAVGCRKR